MRNIVQSQLMMAQAMGAVTEAIASTKTMQTSTRDVVATLDVPTAVTVLNVGGVTTVGDGEAGLYVRVDAEPTSTAKVQSADGQWWSLAPPSSLAVTSIVSAGSAINSPIISAGTAVSAGTSVEAGSFVNAPLYQAEGTQVVGPQIVGWSSPTGSSSRAAFSTGTVTLTALAAHVSQLIKDLKTHGLLGD